MLSYSLRRQGSQRERVPANICCQVEENTLSLMLVPRWSFLLQQSHFCACLCSSCSLFVTEAQQPARSWAFCWALSACVFQGACLLKHSSVPTRNSCVTSNTILQAIQVGAPRTNGPGTAPSPSANQKCWCGLWICLAQMLAVRNNCAKWSPNSGTLLKSTFFNPSLFFVAWMHL